MFVSRKNALTWMTALCLVCSAVTRIAFACLKGAGGARTVWSQIVLPVAACLIFAFITLRSGQERFYRTSVPMWMAAAYFAFLVPCFGFSRMVMALYWIAILFFAVMYTQIASSWGGRAYLLLPLFLAPVGALLYLNRAVLRARDLPAAALLLPDLLMLFGWLLLVFAVRAHPRGEYHPTWGDRSDGRRIRSLPAMSQVSPYIMVTRNTSSNYFTEAIEITHLESYIRRKRREGLTNLGLTHIFVAAYVRTLARYPALNRFVAGQKIYSRGDDVQFCMVAKKEMSSSAPDTVIKVHLTPHDTIGQVYAKINEKIEQVKSTPLDSGFDHTVGALTLVPGVLLKALVWLLRTLDYFGLLPRFLLEVSPFHGSVFFTSMGSLGIPPIYHHLYDFGNLPVFGSFGCKRREAQVAPDGEITERKYVDLKFTLDERIVDGFYYAAFFKHYKRLIRHPELLDLAPERVEADIA